MDIRIESVVVDCADCERLARFWSEALGWRITFQSDEEYVIEPPEGSREVDIAPEILFGKVADRKVVKNRLHFDLRPKDQEAEVQRIVALGATRADVGQRDVSWVVLADPVGDEFCVLAPLPPGQLGTGPTSIRGQPYISNAGGRSDPRTERRHRKGAQASGKPEPLSSS